MSTRLATAASRVLGARVSRRSFLARAALTGTALSVAPMRYLLEPGSAYAATCRCAGTNCDCGSRCCDGYTDFCCSIYGANVCPAGTVAAGWWKADGSGFCDVNGQDRPRYYIDCNAADCGGCGCGGSDTCHHSCDEFRCECGTGRCSHRKAACTSFRYGQCNNHIECVGAIVCRVVTCTPPWELEPNCSAASATDNATRTHHAACLESATPFDVPVFGDWNGDGVKTPGIYRNGVWYLSDTMASGGPDRVFTYGRPGAIPVVGDWLGSGRDGIGVVRGDRWFLKDDASPGRRDHFFTFGRPNDTPLTGDWNGNGRTGVGRFRAGRWMLTSRLGEGPPKYDFLFGDPGDLPLVGDWDGQGRSTPGVWRRGRWLLRNRSSRGAADIDFVYGDVNDRPVVGDWNSNGTVTPGVVRGTRWYLRNRNSTGNAQVVIDFDTSAAPAAEAVHAGKEVS